MLAYSESDCSREIEYGSCRIISCLNHIFFLKRFQIQAFKCLRYGSYSAFHLFDEDFIVGNLAWFIVPCFSGSLQETVSTVLSELVPYTHKFNGRLCLEIRPEKQKS